MNLNCVYQGSCFDRIKELDDDSVDLIVTSPPYADVKSYGNQVNVIHPDNYVDWILPLFHEMYRVIKPSGSIIFNIGDKTHQKEKHIFVFDMVCRIVRETQLQYYDRYTWHGSRMPNGSNKRLNNFTEWIFHFTKDKNSVKFNMDDVREKYHEDTINRYKSKIKLYETLDNGIKVSKKDKLKSLNKKGKTPDGLFYFPTNSNSKGNKHPAPFSVDFPRWFIKALTDQNDVVLDPFIGSGSTAVAAIELNRQWLGFELNPLYVEMVLKRVGEKQNELFNTLFLPENDT